MIKLYEPLQIFTQAKRVTEQRQNISGRELWLTSTAQSLRKWSVPASEVALSDDNGED